MRARARAGTPRSHQLAPGTKLRAAGSESMRRERAASAGSGKRHELRAVIDGRVRRGHAADLGPERRAVGGGHGRRTYASGRQRTRAADGERLAADGFGRWRWAGSWRATDGRRRLGCVQWTAVGG